jgi:hypothetical protein
MTTPSRAPEAVSVPAFEICPFCSHLGFLADNVVLKACEHHQHMVIQRAGEASGSGDSTE